MKKTISLLTTGALLIGCLTGCGASGSAATGSGSGATSEKLEIVTTIFPEYDWVNNILGDRADTAEVTMLMGNGVDLHSYQPTADDMMKISACDLFVYVGGESDDWVEDALEEAVNKDMVTVNLLASLGDKVKLEEVVEGMEHDHDDHDDHDDLYDRDDIDDHDDLDDLDDHDDHDDHDDLDDHHDLDDHDEFDEHVWLSLRNTQILCDAIADGLKRIDPSNAATYQANVDAYKSKLSALDTQYSEAISAAARKTLLFGDRFPFRYMVDDYGLDYYAAFSGCSAETEASFETIIFLATKTDELGLPAIMTIEGNDHRIAETVRDNTKSKDQQILTLDSMQGTTSQDATNGATYISIMENNLEVLKTALG